MRKKWKIVIAALLVVTICQAAKKKLVKEQPEVEISDSMRSEWKDSLKVVSALAAADLQKGDSASALYHFEKAYSLAVKTENKAELITSGIYIGKEYIKDGKNKAAEIVLEQVFNAADQNARWDVKLEASDLLAQLFAARAFYIRANFYLKESYALRDKAAAFVNQQQKAKLQAEFDTMVKDKQKEWAQQQAAANEAALAKDQYSKYLLMGIGALVVIILVLLFRIYQLNKTLFSLEKENDLLLHNKKHNSAEMERLHRLNDELKSKQSENLLRDQLLVATLRAGETATDFKKKV